MLLVFSRLCTQQVQYITKFRRKHHQSFVYYSLNGITVFTFILSFNTPQTCRSHSFSHSSASVHRRSLSRSLPSKVCSLLRLLALHPNTNIQFAAPGVSTTPPGIPTFSWWDWHHKDRPKFKRQDTPSVGVNSTIISPTGGTTIRPIPNPPKVPSWWAWHGKPWKRVAEAEPEARHLPASGVFWVGRKHPRSVERLEKREELDQPSWWDWCCRASK